MADGNSIRINSPSLSGPSERGLFIMRRGVLQLERNITMQGSATYNQNNFPMLLQVQHGTLIMKDGSAIKGHTGVGVSTSYSDSAVYISGTGTPWSWFLMEGGEISGNTKMGCVIRFEAVAHATTSPKFRFQKTGGIIYGSDSTATDANGAALKNDSSRILTGNNLSPSSDAANKVFTIGTDDGKYDGSGNIFLPTLGSDAAKP
jgi:hypothetical protein